MGNGLRTASATVLAFGLTVAAWGESRPSIAVVVYNQSTVPDDCVAHAKDDVVRIYGDAGVDVIWMDPAAVKPVATFAIRLRITRRPIDADRQVMGTAIVAMNDTNGSAVVFYDQVLKSARGSKQDVARLLAYAMAHEMGHLLLPYPAHSPSGIMRPGWDGDDLRHIASGTLQFSAVQANAIRAKASGCCTAATTSAILPLAKP